MTSGPRHCSCARGGGLNGWGSAKGAKPSELRIQTPEELLLSINLTTANAIGLDIPGVILEDYPKAVAELRNAITTGDAVGMARSAHSLKGAVASSAAHGAESLAYDPECRGREGELENASVVLPQLERELERIAVFVAEHKWDA